MSMIPTKLKAFWSDHVWSKVIAVGIVALIAFAYHKYNISSSHAPNSKSIAEERNALLNGSTWQRTVASIDVPGEQVGVKPFAIIFHFLVQGNKITGTSSFEHDEQRFETQFKGEFFNESYLKLEYTHLKGINAFGYIIFKLEQIPTTMSGKCVVFGSITHQISAGKLDLKKIEH